jgi:ABC-type transport system involved in multi-copper enzyme maturation permease subunit
MGYKLKGEINPILIKEMRARMRGGRAYLTLTTTLVILAIFSFALYRLMLATANFSPYPIGPQIGQVLFAGLAFLELALISVIVPALTANTISSEKERLTYEMLLTTPLHPLKILSGKLVSSLSYIFLLIFAVIPLASLVFLFGGVAIRDISKALIVLTTTAIFFGVLGSFYSALIGRTTYATVITYLTVLLISLTPLFIGTLYNVLQMGQAPRWIFIPSPVSALASAISPSIDPQTIMSRFYMIAGPWNIGIPPISYTSIPRPIYHYSLPLFGILSILLYLITTRLIMPARRWNIQWTELLITIVIILGYAGMVSIAYFATTNRYESIRIINTEQMENQTPEVQPTP